MFHTLLFLIVLYFGIGVLIVYPILISRYMKQHNIKSMKNTTKKHEDVGNELLIKAMFFWAPYVYRVVKEGIGKKM